MPSSTERRASSRRAPRESIVEQLRRGHQHKHWIREDSKKGRCVINMHKLQPGDLVCEYKGELISKQEAEKREQQYAEQCGSYLFFFRHAETTKCVDATDENPEFGMGRLINHSRLQPNLVPKVVDDNGTPRIALIAQRLVEEGQELLYDYGERRPEQLAQFPWMAST